MSENAAEVVLCANAVSCARALGSPHRPPAHVRDVSLAIEAGTLNVVFGETGCGKNLLLRLLGLLEVPDAGDVLLRGASTRALEEAARIDLRNRCFGFVFAEPFLLDSFSVAENVAMPLFKISGAEVREARDHTERMLEFVGLRDSAPRSIEMLPLPDRRKVSLARALAHQPEILLVEDADAGLGGGGELGDWMALLRRTRAELGMTVLLSAGRADAVPEPDRTLGMRDGIIFDDSRPVPAGGGVRM